MWGPAATSPGRRAGRRPRLLEGHPEGHRPASVGDGITFSADEVSPTCSTSQYAGITDYEAGSDYAARKDYLSLVTAQALASINGAGLDATDLVDGVREAAQGRHLLAWSSLPAHQAAFEAASVDGALTDSLVVSIINRGSVKLDWYLDVDADLRLTAGHRQRHHPGRARRAAAQRGARAGEPLRGRPQPFGHRLDHEIVEGEYFGMLAVNMPGAATGRRASRAPSCSRQRARRPHPGGHGHRGRPRRDTRHYVVRFTLPGATLAAGGARRPATRHRLDAPRPHDQRRPGPHRDGPLRHDPQAEARSQRRRPQRHQGTVGSRRQVGGAPRPPPARPPGRARAAAGPCVLPSSTTTATARGQPPDRGHRAPPRRPPARSGPLTSASTGSQARPPPRATPRGRRRRAGWTPSGRSAP